MELVILAKYRKRIYCVNQKFIDELSMIKEFQERENNSDTLRWAIHFVAKGIRKGDIPKEKRYIPSEKEVKLE